MWATGPVRKSLIMQATSTDGVRIKFETTGHGHPLVLLHGFFGDRTSWRSAGYVDALAGKFSLILIDARGHGLTALITGGAHAERIPVDPAEVQREADLFRAKGRAAGWSGVLLPPVSRCGTCWNARERLP